MLQQKQKFKNFFVHRKLIIFLSRKNFKTRSSQKIVFLTLFGTNVIQSPIFDIKLFNYPFVPYLISIVSE